MAEQELGRVRDLQVASTLDKLEEVQRDFNLEQEKCHQVILRSLSVAKGTTDTV